MKLPHPMTTALLTRRTAALATASLLAMAAPGVALAGTPKDTLVVALAFDDIITLDPAEAFEISAATPEDIDFTQADAVFVWSELPFAEPDTLGDELADFVDAGGGVVLAGNKRARGWQGGKAQGFDAFDAKAEALALLAEVGAPSWVCSQSVGVQQALAHARCVYQAPNRGEAPRKLQQEQAIR